MTGGLAPAYASSDPGDLAGGLNAIKCPRTIERGGEEKEKEEKAREENWKKRYGTGDGAGRNKRKGW
ncbi:MAG: hypothetical protein ACLU8D_01410 [Enterocloster sp.]